MVSELNSQTEGTTTYPLPHSVEMISNLIYLARHTQTHSEQQHQYLDWAARVIEQMRHNPNVQRG